ncbi:MAG: hypothetical protein WBG86_00325 [Polyangiales bacterium]
MPRRVVAISGWASALAFFLMGLFPFFNADGYGHLAQGRQIARLGYVPRVDTFSFWRTTPQPWTNYEWGYDLGSWWIFSGFGGTGLILVKCLTLAGLGYVLVRLAVRLAEDAPLAAPLALTVLLAVLPIARFRFTVRPQIIGLAFPAFLLAGIALLYDGPRSQRSKRLVLVALFAMQLLWVNVHGSHLLGLVITGIFTAFAWRTAALPWMAALFGAQLVATAVTPFGLSIIDDAIAHLVRPEFRSAVTEWAPWSPTDPLRLLVGPMIISLLILPALRPVVRAGRFGAGYGVLCVLFCFMAFRSTRFVAHQVLLCAPFIAAGLSRAPVIGNMKRGVAVAVVVAAAACMMWTPRLIPDFGFGVGEAKREYPWKSAAQIEQEIANPRVLATIQDSWPMMFAAPRARFLVDGRVPFYGASFVAEVTQSFAQPRAFDRLLTEYDVNVVVIDHTRSDHVPATEFLTQSPTWKLAFVEEGHSLFVREDTLGGLQELRVVGAGFREGVILESQLETATLETELARVDPPDGQGALHGWLRSLEMLRPLVRDGHRAGLRMSIDDEERTRARTAYELLTEAADIYPGFPSIELYRGMAASSACDAENARGALDRATTGGVSREVVLARLEAALRGPDGPARTDALSHLTRLRADQSTNTDPWVLALGNELDVRCP